MLVRLMKKSAAAMLWSRNNSRNNCCTLIIIQSPGTKLENSLHLNHQPSIFELKLAVTLDSHKPAVSDLGHMHDT